jgi:hypothetical protein
MDSEIISYCLDGICNGYIDDAIGNFIRNIGRSNLKETRLLVDKDYAISEKMDDFLTTVMKSTDYSFEDVTGFFDFTYIPQQQSELKLKPGSFDPLPSSSLFKKLSIIFDSLNEKLTENKLTQPLGDGTWLACALLPSLAPIISPFSSTSYDICLTAYKTISNLASVNNIIKRNKIFSSSLRSLLNRIVNVEKRVLKEEEVELCFVECLNQNTNNVCLHDKLVRGNNINIVFDTPYFIIDHYHRVMFSQEAFFFLLNFSILCLLCTGWILSISISPFPEFSGRSGFLFRREY